MQASASNAKVEENRFGKRAVCLVIRGQQVRSDRGLGCAATRKSALTFLGRSGEVLCEKENAHF